MVKEEIIIEDKLVDFETAKLAKEKGFNNVKVNYLYYIGYGSIKPSHKLIEAEVDISFIGEGQPHLALVPTQTQLRAWLRYFYKIHIEVKHYVDDDVESYDVSIHEPNTWNEKDVFLTEPIFKTYEEAEKVGLKEGLKLINKID